MRYDEPKNNEWIKPIYRNYKMMCCDCGLVHNTDFRIYKGKIQFRVRRNNRSTALARRVYDRN
jgi:hypothetical protein